ncbi:MAG: hypothetical protein ACK4P3_00655 [Fimbriimonadaceae bacterium]
MLPRLRQLIDRTTELPTEDQETVCDAIEQQLERLKAGLVGSGRPLTIMDLAFGKTKVESGVGRG